VQDLDSLRLLIQSHIPLIFIRSREEQRALALITRAAIQLGLPVYRWLATEGLQRLETSLPPQRIHMEPDAALGHIRSVMERGLYVLVDFHAYLDHPLHRRLLKDIALGYAQAPRTVILLAPEIDVPAELRGLSAMFELSLPGERSCAISCIRWRTNGRVSRPRVERCRQIRRPWICWCVTSPASPLLMPDAWPVWPWPTARFRRATSRP